MQHQQFSAVTPPPPEQKLQSLTTLIYALQAASFLIPITFLVALVINYIKRDEVRGTRFESHFRWQIRTFWFTALWFFVGYLTLVVLAGYLILFAVPLWVIYRIARGWLRLSDGRSMYTPG